jgi:hypothetical protein
VHACKKISNRFHTFSKTCTPLQVQPPQQYLIIGVVYNLLEATASASSKNIMLGAASRACRNVSRSRASPSPTYMEYKSAPLRNGRN